MTWDRVVCVFPHATFVHNETFDNKSRGSRYSDQSNRWDKAIEDSITIGRAGHFVGASAMCGDTRTGKRHVGDQWTWILNFDVNGEYQNFELKNYGTANDGNKDFKIHTQVNFTTSEEYEFEILHLTSQVTRKGAFLRICEPFKLR